MFEDFYKNLANDLEEGIDDFLNDASNLKMDMKHLNVNYTLKTEKLGSGTYGDVVVGTQRNTGTNCAIKRLKLEQETEGFPITALREITILKDLKHDNIVKFEEMVYTMSNEKNNFKMEFYLVFELCAIDLISAFSKQLITKLFDRKLIMFQLLKGTKYLHSEKIMHRDLKPANILISFSGSIRIADFGLSRSLKPEPNPRYTSKVVTIWYRPPELLLDIRQYTEVIDVWSLACIFYELWTCCALFKGVSEWDQLDRITRLCGGINYSVWPGIEQHLKGLKQDFRPSTISDFLRKEKIEPSAVVLISKMLTYDPKKRLTCEEALKEKFFSELPKPLGYLSFRDILNKKDLYKI